MDRPKTDLLSTRLCEIEKHELKLTPANRLFLVTPEGKIHFPYINSFGQVTYSGLARRTQGPNDPAPFPAAVESRVREVLKRVAFVKAKSREDALSDPGLEFNY